MKPSKYLLIEDLKNSLCDCVLSFYVLGRITAIKITVNRTVAV